MYLVPEVENCDSCKRK